MTICKKKERSNQIADFVADVNGKRKKKSVLQKKNISQIVCVCAREKQKENFQRKKNKIKHNNHNK